MATLLRLSRMPWREVAVRGRQEASKWIDRLTAVDRAMDAPGLVARHCPELALPTAALQVLRESAPHRFFAGAVNPSATGRLPDYRRHILEAAESTLHHRFDLLGYRTLWFGDPIDWHVDPVSARRSPRQHWSRLDPLDHAQVGDSKIVWELNRHQWLARQAQAYAFTGEERYAEACMHAIESWVEANPYGVGINWSSSLEVGYRLMSWSWMLLLLRNSAALSGERLQTILAAFWLHADHVARYLSYYFSPNTHLTGEALALFYAGTLFPEFTDARRWRTDSARILIVESEAQICADGVHFERSTCYHRYTIETYQQFVLLAERNHIAVPRELIRRLNRSVDFLLAIRQPDGRLPEIGDADGGRLLPLTERQQRDPRGVLAVAAAMFQRGDCAWAAEGMAPEVPLLMGDEGALAFERVAMVPPAGSTSSWFPSGGYGVMSSGADRAAHQMIVDVGPLGCPVSAGHGHADLLSVQCSVFGEPCLVDAGTYCYTAAREWRNFFRGTAAHNTMRVDGRDQAEPNGPFSWRRRPRVTVHEWRSNAEHDFIDAEHDGYAGLTHRRRVMFVKPDYWFVVDDLTVARPDGAASTAGTHRVELGFQFAPMQVETERQGWALARTPGGSTLWVGVFASSTVRSDVKTGELAPIRGWVSPDYGQRTAAPFLVYAGEAALPWRSVTLLMPSRGVATNSTSGRPSVAPLYDDQHLPIALELEGRRESVFVDETDAFISRS